MLSKIRLRDSVDERHGRLSQRLALLVLLLLHVEGNQRKDLALLGSERLELGEDLRRVDGVGVECVDAVALVHCAIADLVLDALLHHHVGGLRDVQEPLGHWTEGKVLAVIL